MKSKITERKLIFEDNTIYTSLVVHLPRVFRSIGKLKTEYEKLEIGAFDNDVYQDLITSGAKNIESRYNESLNNTLNGLGAINSQIRANLLSNTETAINDLKNALATFRNTIPTSTISGHSFPIHLITIVDGLPVLTDDCKEEIKELHCRIYLTSESEFELYAKLENLTTSYNSLLKTLDKIGYKQHFEMNSLDVFLSVDEIDKKAAIKPDAISYAIDYNNLYQLSIRR
jgi:hypothetical protein